MSEIEEVLHQVRKRLKERGKRTEEELVGMMVAIMNVTETSKDNIATQNGNQFTVGLLDSILPKIKKLRDRLIIKEIASRVDWNARNYSPSRILDHAVGFSCSSQCPFRNFDWLEHHDSPGN